MGTARSTGVNILASAGNCDKKKIGESMLIDILEYDDTKENPHSGWFNIDKVELVAGISYYNK